MKVENAKPPLTARQREIYEFLNPPDLPGTRRRNCHRADDGTPQLEPVGVFEVE